LIDQMDQPVPQVILEMKILELDVSEGSDIGFNYSFSGTEVKSQPTKFDFTTGQATEGQAGLKSTAQVGNFATQAASTFVYQYLSEDFTARVQMLAQDSNVDVIATPLLIAANNRAARIEVGEERVLTVGASSDTNVAGNNGAVSQFINIETERRTIGTTLSIIPRINQDKTVTLYVEQESSTLLAGNNSITVGSTNVPIDSVDTANISATVVAKDRYTIAVGGLIRSERSVAQQKVPLLGDIPLAGQFFSQKSEALRKSELILLIRPYIIDDSALADQRTKDLVEELSDHHYHSNGHGSIDENNTALERHVEQLEQGAEKEEIIKAPRSRHQHRHLRSGRNAAVRSL
jgi:general secretion pathway protein D